jgi:hypothetical protein
MAVPADDRDRVRAALARPPAPRGQVKVGGVVYELVGEEERVDPGWEERNALEAHARWESERAARLADRQAGREQLTLGARLDRALVEIELGLGKAARAITAGRSTEDGSPAGLLHDVDQNGTARVDFGPDIDQPLKWIRHHVQAIEEALDAELGLLDRAPVGDRPGRTGERGVSGRMMSTGDRDRVVFDDFQGVRADDVARQAPYLGSSARTIERARTAEAERRGVIVRPVDGEILGVETRGERLIRRVQIT